ncbi:MAG: hypothetical protein FWH34_04735 [Desulfovibrionaceae bacterium]|nr:hypothetical protein [Desulfovibrionaceae bacterium]
MKRIFFLIILLIPLLIFGTSLGDDITGTYTNEKNGAILRVKRSGKKYIVTLQSKNKECDFESRAELKRWNNRGFDLGLLDIGYTTYIKSNEHIYIDVPTAAKHCQAHVEGDYKKR